MARIIKEVRIIESMWILNDRGRQTRLLKTYAGGGRGKSTVYSTYCEDARSGFNSQSRLSAAYELSAVFLASKLAFYFFPTVDICATPHSTYLVVLRVSLSMEIVL